LVVIGRRWSSLVVIGCHWSSLVVIGRRWLSLVVVGRRWAFEFDRKTFQKLFKNFSRKDPDRLNNRGPSSVELQGVEPWSSQADPQLSTCLVDR